MSARLEVLKGSLLKKEAALDQKINSHFADVKQANGQPLNDKRNGHATLNRWEKQNASIRNQKEEVEKTKNAIEREETKISYTKYWYDLMPSHVQELIDNGTLTQWSKHPRMMFVDGVDRARIVFNEETGMCAHRFVTEITDKEQYAKFRDVYNAINAKQQTPST